MASVQLSLVALCGVSFFLAIAIAHSNALAIRDPNLVALTQETESDDIETAFAKQFWGLILGGDEDLAFELARMMSAYKADKHAIKCHRRFAPASCKDRHGAIEKMKFTEGQTLDDFLTTDGNNKLLWEELKNEMLAKISQNSR